VIEGGEMKFSSGTSAGGATGTEVQNTVIEGGGNSDGGQSGQLVVEE
jgi:hypothetical protein